MTRTCHVLSNCRVWWWYVQWFLCYRRLAPSYGPCGPGRTLLFKPPPPVGAGGCYMFSGRPSVPLSVRPCVRPSVRDSRGSFMFPRYLQYLLTDFAKLLSLVHLGTQTTWLRFWVKRSKFKVTPLRRRRTALPSSATFSSFTIACNESSISRVSYFPSLNCLIVFFTNFKIH